MICNNSTLYNTSLNIVILCFTVIPELLWGTMICNNSTLYNTSLNIVILCFTVIPELLWGTMICNNSTLYNTSLNIVILCFTVISELLWGTMSASVVCPLRGRQPEAPRTKDRSGQRSLTPEFHNKPVSVALG